MSAVSGVSSVSAGMLAALSRAKAEGTSSEEAKESQIAKTREQVRDAASPAMTNLGKMIDRYA
ncbi:MAG: hypothetical protein ACYDIE_05360 [Candidatus Krumholzibacteriia bacterium]